jgi:hypothetical protein
VNGLMNLFDYNLLFIAAYVYIGPLVFVTTAEKSSFGFCLSALTV